jgi:hypothetical protein
MTGVTKSRCQSGVAGDHRGSRRTLRVGCRGSFDSLNPIALCVLHIAVFCARIPIHAVSCVVGGIALAHFSPRDAAVHSLKDRGQRLPSILQQVCHCQNARLKLRLAQTGKNRAALILLGRECNRFLYELIPGGAACSWLRRQSRQRRGCFRYFPDR